MSLGSTHYRFLTYISGMYIAMGAYSTFSLIELICIGKDLAMVLLGGSISAGGDVHVAKTESYFGQTAVRPTPVLSQWRLLHQLPHGLSYRRIGRALLCAVGGQQVAASNPTPKRLLYNAFRYI